MIYININIYFMKLINNDYNITINNLLTEYLGIFSNKVKEKNTLQESEKNLICKVFTLCIIFFLLGNFSLHSLIFSNDDYPLIKLLLIISLSTPTLTQVTLMKNVMM